MIMITAILCVPGAVVRTGASAPRRNSRSDTSLAAIELTLSIFVIVARQVVLAASE
ncbi:hypothetical protein [Sorangium sp. So ce1153]|uniref:hypothetical protein n=1 Tax=Sorangium sp. So ce1153 TaxID=3133333 RepID=UPI003F63959D